MNVCFPTLIQFRANFEIVSALIKILWVIYNRAYRLLNPSTADQSTLSHTLLLNRMNLFKRKKSSEAISLFSPCPPKTYSSKCQQTDPAESSVLTSCHSLIDERDDLHPSQHSINPLSSQHSVEHHSQNSTHRHASQNSHHQTPTIDRPQNLFSADNPQSNHYSQHNQATQHDLNPISPLSSPRSRPVSPLSSVVGEFFLEETQANPWSGVSNIEEDCRDSDSTLEVSYAQICQENQGLVDERAAREAYIERIERQNKILKQWLKTESAEDHDADLDR
jgi:hypothetical protein